MDVLGKLEGPVAGTVVDTYPMQVFGWALSQDGSDVDIEIAVDGEVRRNVDAALARADIAADHPEIGPGSLPRSTFRTSVPARRRSR